MEINAILYILNDRIHSMERDIGSARSLTSAMLKKSLCSIRWMIEKCGIAIKKHAHIKCIIIQIESIMHTEMVNPKFKSNCNCLHYRIEYMCFEKSTLYWNDGPLVKWDGKRRRIYESMSQKGREGLKGGKGTVQQSETACNVLHWKW